MLLKRLKIGEYIKRLILKRQQTEEVLVTPSLRHCLNKYKLAREGEKDEDLEKVNNHIFDKERCSLGLI